jgi:hypothetical protein
MNCPGLKARAIQDGAKLIAAALKGQGNFLNNSYHQPL